MCEVRHGRAIVGCLVVVLVLVLVLFAVGCRTTTNYTITVSPVVLGTESETRAKSESIAEQGKVVEVAPEIARAAQAAVGPAAKVDGVPGATGEGAEE